MNSKGAKFRKNHSLSPRYPLIFRREYKKSSVPTFSTQNSSSSNNTAFYAVSQNSSIKRLNFLIEESSRNQKSLQKRVRVSAEAIPVNRSISPGLLAAGWIILPFLSILPDPYWLVSFLSYIILLPVQMAVNNINESVAPGHHKNENFTGWNIFGLVLVGLVLAIISFFPPE